MAQIWGFSPSPWAKTEIEKKKNTLTYNLQNLNVDCNVRLVL